MKGRSALLRALWIAALSFGLGGVAVAAEPTAKAAPYENLMVPSPSMGRDIPVAFLAGGPHAVYLLDAFNAGPDVSNWVTAGNAMNTLAGKGISVVAPAGGAYSMYTNWEQDGSKQWDTFLSAELPDWLAANRGLAPVAMRPLAPLRAVTGRWRWRPSTPTASASLARCRAFCTRRTPPPTVRSRRACSNSAVWTPTECGSTTAGSVEVARPVGACQPAGAKQHPGVGVEPDQPGSQRSRRHDRPSRRGDG